MSLSNYGENQFCETLRGKTLYLKLHTGDPGEECTANAAAETTRKKIEFAAPSGGAMKNSNVLEWTGLAETEEVSHFSLWDASSEGNAWISGQFSEKEKLTKGKDARIKAETVTVTMD